MNASDAPSTTTTAGGFAGAAAGGGASLALPSSWTSTMQPALGARARIASIKVLMAGVYATAADSGVLQNSPAPSLQFPVSAFSRRSCGERLASGDGHVAEWELPR